MAKIFDLKDIYIGRVVRINKLKNSGKNIIAKSSFITYGAFSRMVDESTNKEIWTNILTDETMQMLSLDTKQGEVVISPISMKNLSKMLSKNPKLNLISLEKEKISKIVEILNRKFIKNNSKSSDLTNGMQ